MTDPQRTISSICVCACTYQRPDGLGAMLDGIARQTFTTVPRPALQIVIADNECSDNTRTICEAFERAHGIPLTYVREVRRGISHARNAYLDNIPAGFDFLASIDDDEVPDPDWLERLIEAQVATGADIVQGAVYPVFAEGTPEWLVAGGFYGRPRRDWSGSIPKMEEYQDLDQAGTGNVLIRIESIAAIGLRFDVRLGLTGGEDTKFSRALLAAGSRIVWAPRARVSEAIPPDRATVWYRLKLEYRIGNNPLPPKFDPKRRRFVKRVRKVWIESGPARILSGIGDAVRASLSGDASKERLMVAALRVAYGLGRSSRALGLTYSPYR